MGSISCEICGGTSLAKDPETGNFVCQDCGASYSAESLRKMLNSTSAAAPTFPTSPAQTPEQPTGNLEYNNCMYAGDRYFDNGDYSLARAEYSKALLAKEGDLLSEFMTVVCELWITHLGGNYIDITRNPLMRLHKFVDEERTALLKKLSALPEGERYRDAYIMVGKLCIYFINMRLWKMEDAANASSKTTRQWSIETIDYFDKTWAETLSLLLAQAFKKSGTIGDDDLRFFLLAAKCGRDYGYCAEKPYTLIKEKYGECHANDEAIANRVRAIEDDAKKTVNTEQAKINQLTLELGNLGKTALLKKRSIKSEIKTAQGHKSDAENRINHASDYALEEAWEAFLKTVA